MNKQPIRVKFLSTEKEAVWLHQLPNNDPSFKNCLFIFDKDESEYDWLVVYEDMPRPTGTRITLSQEELRCHPNNTILITQEPSSIKYYGNNYTKQFGHVLTSQPKYALPHKNRHYTQPSLFWFYGVGNQTIKSYNNIVSDVIPKTKNLSVVWSNKKQLHTIHHQRLKFLQLLRENINDIDVYGRGEKPLDDKANALDDYKYHIAIENHFGLHHWTEKLADPLLGLSLPFYYGCPNLEDYFPKDSFIRIDIYQPHKSLQIIQDAINNNEYGKRHTALKEAKNKLVQEYNLFVILNNIIETKTNKKPNTKNTILYSRRLANRKDWFSALNYLFNKTLLRLRYFTKNNLSKPKIDL